MNITDAVEEKIPENKLQAIFDRQKELMTKYHDIEKASGLLQTEDCPVNLHDKRGQARIKDFAWRVTEELGEALDALYVDNDDVHYKEELADGLHFLTELSILAGLTPKDIADFIEAPEDLIFEHLVYPRKTTLNYMVANFIRSLGMTCNCLKNKPWKQSQMLTDVPHFYARLCDAWFAYFGILSDAFESGDEIVSTYFKKSQVNKFRQRSNY